MNRKRFIQGVAGTGLLAMTIPLRSQSPQEREKLDPAIVQEFVGICHRDFENAKAMLAEYPTLLNAANDWGGGDFETGLGAASHVGHKDLAKYLMDMGAQANIFTACLFGKAEVVKPMLMAFPKLIDARGPHGYTLLHHAEIGGEEAVEVREFLISLGAEKKIFDLFPPG